MNQITPFIISQFVNAFFLFIFMLMVYYRTRDKALRITFLLFLLAVFFWSVSYGIWLLPSVLANYEIALFWTRILSFGSLFIPVFFFHYITVLLKIKNKLNKLILRISYGITLSLAFFAFPFSPFTHYFVRGVEPEMFFPYWPKPGPLYLVFLFGLFGLLLLYILFLLIKSYRSSSGRLKEQTKYVLVGSILGFGGGATNYFLWFGIHLLPYGTPLVPVGIFLLFYAIIRHRLGDITVAIGKIGIYIFTSLSVVAYVLGFYYSAN